MSSALDERRAQQKRYKEDVETRGKAFHPYAMFHDVVMSLVVVTVIVALACIWYFTADEAIGAGRRLDLRRARRALRGEGRPGDDELHPAA